jgi:hypothetical protein
VADRRVPLSRLRALWLALPVLPWIASLLPWFAPFFSWPWLLQAIYFAPAHRIAIACDVAPETPAWFAFELAQALGLSLALDAAMRALARRAGRWRTIRVRTARAVALAVTAVAIPAFALRYAQWVDWPARSTGPAPYFLEEQAAHIRELTVYELPGGFIDRAYVARLRGTPELPDELIRTFQLEPIDAASVPASFWSGPPAYWWRPPRGGRFHASHDFPWTGRGRDGDHYALLRTDDDELWLWVKANF